MKAGILLLILIPIILLSDLYFMVKKLLFFFFFIREKVHIQLLWYSVSTIKGAKPEGLFVP